MPNASAVQMHHTVRRFKVTMNVNRLIEIKLAIRSPAQGVDHVMRVFSPEARKHDPFLVRLPIAIGISEMQQLCALTYIRAAIARNHRGRNEQSLCEHRRFFRAMAARM